MKKIVTTALAAVAGLLGLSKARGEENPYYDPDYDPELDLDAKAAYISVLDWDRDAPDEVWLTFDGVTPFEEAGK